MIYFFLPWNDCFETKHTAEINQSKHKHCTSKHVLQGQTEVSIFSPVSWLDVCWMSSNMIRLFESVTKRGDLLSCAAYCLALTKAVVCKNLDQRTETNKKAKKWRMELKADKII
ncbi:hypothetical protein AMECASPLE_035432 [Ameca splendens]|uniref:Uncharacterized protein n=1 Tax=Ameca splendens TaxID=208324 RepID=A0ABV0Z7I2_9TELE